MNNSDSNRARFGPFEVDLHTHEIWKNGVQLKLMGQPFETLTVLISRPGELVTREELRTRLWPKDTFVDFDHGLNAAVNKLREALNDSAESPKYVQTLPRLGYRFIAPVTQNVPQPPAQQAQIAGLISTPAVPSSISPEVAESQRASARKVRKFLVPAAVLVVALSGVFAWFSRPIPPPRILSITQITHDGFGKKQVLTDGTRLYMTESKGPNQFILGQASVAGGETSIIPTPFTNVFLDDISPDRSQLLVVDYTPKIFDERQLWVLPLPTGSPRRLSNIVAHDAAWSPDGRIVFANGSGIFFAKPDGTDVNKLLTVSGMAGGMHFSPDGGRIRFMLFDPKYKNATSLWEIRTDGGDLHPVFPSLSRPLLGWGGVWSRDGRYYFFTRAELSSSNVWVSDIWASREPTGRFWTRPSEPIQLTTGPMSLNFFTSSPDGKKLFAQGGVDRGELVVYDSKVRQFLPFLSGIFAGEVDFSRDGKWVAYVTFPEHTLWRSRTDGSERLQLTYLPMDAFLPRWSPDGTQIAYTGKGSKSFIVSAQGGTPQEVSEKVRQVDASWSPDGKKMVFGGEPWRPGSSESVAIHILDLKSKQLSKITGSDGVFSPRWSPDGQHLAAVSFDTNKLLLFDFKTQKWTDWVNEPGTVGYPIWSSDGRYIYYENGATQTPSYRRVKLGETHSQLVVDLKRLSQYGTWAGITPDGSPLFVRDMSTDEIYALDLELP